MEKAACWVSLCALCSALVCGAAGADIFVAANGNDAWSGALAGPDANGTDGPFATLERARDEIRKLKQAGAVPSGGISVILGGGIYSLAKPFELTTEDSGTPDAPITYQGKPGETARLVGGISVTNFAAVSDPAVLERLDAPVRDSVMQADLKALGVTDYGSPEGGGITLYFAGKPMTLARWPNEGFVKIVDIVVDDGHKIHGIPGSTVGQFTYEGDRPARWAGEKDPWLHGYWFWDWSDQRQKIESINTEKSIISLVAPYHNYGYRKGQWYYAYNMLSELDAPGEWYLDRETGMLYFWPPEPVEQAETLVSVLPTLVTCTGVSNVALRGLTFEAARGTALTMAEGAGNRVAACVFRNCGGAAVSVSGGQNHGVMGCDIYQMGAGGIAISGGDRTTLTPAGHFAENNHIHTYGMVKPMYNAGISVNGVGNRVAHNLIHDAPHMAIQFGGNDHVFEFNEMYRVCEESNDAGAMYAGRNWTMRGHVIRYNYLHHINGFEDRGCVGVYLDDMFASATITGNVFYKVTRAAFIGGGRDCIVENNIFVDCDPALHVDARALNWAAYHADEWLAEAKEKGTISGIEYTKPPYSERYPQLPTILDREPKAPEGNVIARNICWGGRWDEVEDIARPYLQFENNLLDEDPHFVDAASQDFRLKDDSPALALGFKPIPQEQIGLYQDDSRASWPVKHGVEDAPGEARP